MERGKRQGPGDDRCLINQTTVPLGNGKEESRPRKPTVPTRVQDPLTATGEQVGPWPRCETREGAQIHHRAVWTRPPPNAWWCEAWGRPRSALRVLLHDLGGGREQGESFPGLLKFRNVKF